MAAKKKTIPKATTRPANAPEVKKSQTAATAPVSPETKPKENVVITKAKGRPMLNWVGKRPLRAVTAFPAQHVESFAAPDAANLLNPTPELWKAWPARYLQGGLLFHGDNKEVLAHLLANGFRGKVQLFYIDPPFDSGADYVRKIALRGSKGTAELDGESYSLGEQIQYEDIWANDTYLQFMFERLLLLKELLTEDGSMFLHCDWRMVHRLRCILDEIFGASNFVNEIVWKHTVLGGTHGRRLGKAHETILWYAKGQGYKLNSKSKAVRVPFGDYIKKTLRKDADGRWFYSRGRMSRQPSAEEVSKKAHTITYVDSPDAGTLVSDLWDDMPAYRVYGDEDAEYPTQKNESLIERFVELASDPGDIVMDCFLGSGTTVSVAQKLGRRWLGCDINKGAIQTSVKRVHGVMTQQVSGENVTEAQGELLPDTIPIANITPAQLSFDVWRVNDYDLAIQHNEAVNLACEHIGVTRMLTDSFFDGALGKKLVKIIPFGHPLSLTDLEDVRKELDARGNESRDVVVVSLGKELGVDVWLTNWNRMRKQGDTPNKIEIIELRSDPKYGKFIAHKPASARVEVRRTKDKLIVEVKDFVSPTVLERLQEHAGPLLAPKVPDWRAMVDSVMIDPAFDGQVFRITLADVPERKQDYVQATYELDAPSVQTTVAVKITDMLGEEVLVQKTV
jgi:DNA modification methylase